MSLPTIPATSAHGLSPARRDAIERFYGALASRDFDMVDDALTHDWEDIPLAPGQAHGPAGIKPIFATLVSAFPDLTIDIVDALGEDDRAAVRVQCAGTHDGDLFGVAATGRSLVWASKTCCIPQRPEGVDRSDPKLSWRHLCYVPPSLSCLSA